MSMQPFSYAKADDIVDVLEIIGQDVRPLAGGTDLLNLMKEGLAAPSGLVSIKEIAALQGIALCEGTLCIGATTTLTQLLRSAEISGPGWRVLQEALLITASPQLRHMATLGGNLIQQPRCWYYRNLKTHCWRKGGRLCYAFKGENRGHVLFGGGPCYAVHPSDPAVALAAMGAGLVIVGPQGERRLSLDAFYQSPNRDCREDHVLAPDELITQIRVPQPDADTVGVYVKVADREAWDFALASVAVQLTLKNRTVTRAGVYLGSVAPHPWRAEAAEQALVGQALDNTTMDTASEAATEGAKALEHNGYKIDLLHGIMRQALQRLVEA